MDTRLKHHSPVSYPIVFEPGEYELLRDRSRADLRPRAEAMLVEKMKPILLRHYHEDLDPRELVIRRCLLPRRVPKFWGILVVEVAYGIGREPGSYRQVFNLILDNGDLSGQLFTQSRRFVPAK